MSKEFSDFLTSRELDHLMMLREDIPALDAEDHQVVAQLIGEGKSYQAIANLIMYPELIPEQERVQALLNGLRETENTYLVLAAIVGLGRIPEEALPEPLRDTVVQEVLRSLHQYGGVIAERASVVLADKTWWLLSTPASELVGLLGHPSGAVRHNVLVALIPLVGLVHLRGVIGEAVEEGRLSLEAARETEEKLMAIEGFGKDDTVDEETFDLGMLTVPLLAYIPNFEDWRVDTAP
ncbi:MAG: hypothetical protein RLZZ165_1711 [Bacteroidota bacterium]